MQPPPPPKGGEGYDITGGGDIPTGDPYFDAAMREYRDDQCLGVDHPTKWIMDRAKTLFAEAHRANNVPADAEQVYIARAAVVKLIEASASDQLRGGGWIPKTEFDAAVTVKSTEILQEGGWVNRAALGADIEVAAARIASGHSLEQLKSMRDSFILLVMACFNAFLMLALPMPYKAYYGLVVCLVYGFLTVRIHRRFTTMINATITAAEKPLTESDHSVKMAEHIITKAGIPPSTTMMDRWASNQNGW